VLDDLVKDFCNGKAHALRIEQQADPSLYLVFGRANPCPDDWGYIIGDVANAARSSLDYIVDRLSTLAPDDPGRNRIGFPICDTPKEWSDRIPSSLRDVDHALRISFEEFQPYKRSVVDDPLGLLREINNRDKHRSVRVVTAFARFMGVGLVTSNAQVSGGSVMPFFSGNINFGDTWRLRHVGTGEISEAESIVAEIRRMSDNAPNARVAPLAVPTIQFAVGQSRIERREVIPTLRGAIDRVKEVLLKFP